MSEYIDSPITQDIYNSLFYNLNYYKRVEGNNNNPMGVQGNKHFYETAVNNSRLKQLGELCGCVFPNWGDIIRTRTGQTVIAGGWYVPDGQDGHYVNVGLRWAESIGDWEDKSDGGNRNKNVRTVQGVISRPQIVVTIRPLKYYYILFDECLTRNGLSNKLDPKLVYQHRIWQRKDLQIIPLKLYIRRQTFGIVSPLLVNDKSMDDRHKGIYTEEDQQEQAEKDEAWNQEIMKLGHDFVRRRKK